MLKALAVLALALAAAPPVARGPGLVVSQGGHVWVDGVRVARGTQPAWSPDGRRIAFVRDGEVHVAAADGSGDRRLTPGSLLASAPAWSPDGTRIAFGGVRDIFTVRLVDRKVTNLTHSPKPWLGNFTPAYSPDGRRIAFSRSTDAFNTDIFLMSANGTSLKRLTRSRGTDTHLAEEHGPAWSPDGKTLVYVSNRTQTSFELFSIGVDGRGERQITNTPSPRHDEDAPRFSRDGRRILYAHDGRIATMNRDGSGVRELGLGVSADWR